VLEFAHFKAMISAGEQIGRYKIRSAIGKGGMGEVFLAEDTELERVVALKVLPEDLANDPERMRRFVQEAKSASALNHPNIITIHEIGKTDNTHFIATEYIEGETLHSRLRSEPINLKSVLDIAIQIASALDAAHRTGIVHRDIKPENIMIRPDGLVKILDFGIAKLTEKKADSIDAEAATAIKAEGTSPGMIIGTASYMSPEQAKGKPIDARSDIFSFGVVLYEMLSGKQPFEGENALDVIGSILNKEPTPIQKLIPEVPQEIGRIIGKTLKKNREERYQTAKDLLIDLKDVRQDLELQNKLERTSSPNREESKTQILGATTSAVAQTTSSAEYVASEIKRNKRGFIIALSILFLGAISLGYWYFQNSARNVRSASFESIAVLPFVNQSGNADTEYLSDGMTETLINSLSQIPELSVKARSSVFRYKGKDVEPQQIGNELSVQAILSGRVLQRADNITLNLELVDVRTGNQIWGEQYNRKTTDLVSLQGDIARNVLNKLQNKLTGAGGQILAKKLTTDSEAYQLYLKGLFHWNKRTADELKKAIEYFNQAKEKDPSFALAYAGLAVTYSVLPSNALITKEETSEALLKAKAAALKALELDSTLAEPHAVLGNLKIGGWDFAGAENEFKRAIELNPNYASAHQWYSELLARLGRNEEALAEIKKAYELDPFSTAVNMNLGLRYADVRRVDEALNQFKKTIEISPNYPMAHWYLGEIYFEKGMYEESLAAFFKGNVLLKLETPESAEQKNVALRQALKTEGEKGYWRKILEFELDLYKKGINPPFYVAGAYAKLGEKEKAFEWLEKSYAERDFNLTYLKTNRNFDDLRSNPRFQELLRRVGLPQ
jgi:serine/threonine-protein kinase